jgi:hypothetical protein
MRKGCNILLDLRKIYIYRGETERDRERQRETERDRETEKKRGVTD